MRRACFWVLPSQLGWPPALIPLQRGLHGNGRMYQGKWHPIPVSDRSSKASPRSHPASFRQSVRYPWAPEETVSLLYKASDLLRKSFTAACLGCRPRILLQLRPCKPIWSNLFQFSINCAGYDDSCFSNTYIVGCGVHTCPVEAI